jgi:hypothetical protein
MRATCTIRLILLKIKYLRIHVVRGPCIVAVSAPVFNFSIILAVHVVSCLVKL